jgi:hypothetical protein
LNSVGIIANPAQRSKNACQSSDITFEPLGEVPKVLQGAKNFPGGKLHRKYLSMSLVNMNDQGVVNSNNPRIFG